MSFLENIIIIGIGGHAKVVHSIIKRIQGEPNNIFFIDAYNKRFDFFLGEPVLGGLESGIEIPFSNCKVINAFGGDAYKGVLMRKTLDQKFAKLVPQSLNYEYINVIDKSVISIDGLKIGKGNFVGFNAILGPSVEIKDKNIINNKVLIEHDCKIGSNNIISPGAIVLGAVTMGDEIFIGSGTIIRNGITIGDNAIIGMGSNITKNIPPNVTIYGNPAKIIKFNK